MKNKFHKRYFNLKRFEKKAVLDFDIVFLNKDTYYFNNETQVFVNNKTNSSNNESKDGEIYHKDNYPFVYDDFDSMSLKYIRKEDVDFKSNLLTSPSFIPQIEIQFDDENKTKHVDYIDLEYILSWLSKDKRKQKLMKKSTQYKYLKETPFGKQWKTHCFDDLFFTCDCGVPECNGYFDQQLKRKDNRIILRYYTNQGQKYIKIQFDHKIFIEKVKKAYVEFLSINSKLISVFEDLDKKGILSLSLIDTKDIKNIENDKKLLSSLKNIALKDYFKDDNGNLLLNIQHSENYYHYFINDSIDLKKEQEDIDCNDYIQFTIINEMKNVIFLKNLFEKVISKFK